MKQTTMGRTRCGLTRKLQGVPRLVRPVRNTYLLHGHASTEHGGDGEVASVSRITRSHHVLGVEHLLDELGHSEGTVLLTAARRQRREARHEEVKTRERHHVHGQFAQVGVQLPATRITTALVYQHYN